MLIKAQLLALSICIASDKLMICKLINHQNLVVIPFTKVNYNLLRVILCFLSFVFAKRVSELATKRTAIKTMETIPTLSSKKFNSLTT